MSSRPSVRFFPRWNPNTGDQIAGLIQLIHRVFLVNPAATEWVEIGTHRGESALIISAFPSVHKLYTVDSTLGDCIAEVEQRLANRLRENRVEIIRQTSLAFSKTLEPESVDVVYVDGDHSYDAVSADIAAYWPLIRKNGFLAGHDYCETHADVMFAVDEFLAAHPDLKMHWFEDSSWLIHKRV